eukprot:4612289-Amphidinium_carterae.1
MQCENINSAQHNCGVAWGSRVLNSDYSKAHHNSTQGCYNHHITTDNHLLTAAKHSEVAKQRHLKANHEASPAKQRAFLGRQKSTFSIGGLFYHDPFCYSIRGIQAQGISSYFGVSYSFDHLSSGGT